MKQEKSIYSTWYAANGEMRAAIAAPRRRRTQKQSYSRIKQTKMVKFQQNSEPRSDIKLS